MNKKTPALLDFYAEWCGPCKVMKPAIDAIEKKYEGQLEVRKVNVDDFPDIAEMYSVKSIPTLVFIDSFGLEVNRTVGSMSAAKLEETLKNLLDKAAKLKDSVQVELKHEKSGE